MLTSTTKEQLVFHSTVSDDLEIDHIDFLRDQLSQLVLLLLTFSSSKLKPCQELEEPLPVKLCNI